MNIAMRLGRKTAKNFSLRDDENQLFKHCWNWRKNVEKTANVSKTEMKKEVERQFDIFAKQVKGQERSSEMGHHYIHRAPTEGRKYVIFSDHHWSDENNRQNFFGFSGNRDLYIEILKKYYDEGYTVIENGDVEELVIFEPTVQEVRKRAEMNENELAAYRKEYRKTAMDKIINDPRNKDLYEILRKFHDDNRYIKVVGNHDYDLQFDETYEVLQEAFPGIERPYDYVFLESKEKIEYAILHGHQFDDSTNPVYAKIFGETISESLAWAYQGPDRIWNWETHGIKWAEEQKPFLNQIGGSFSQNRSQTLRAIGAALGTLKSHTGWEDLFQHEVAWEYFYEENPKLAYKREVQVGNQWFKFRHMDEVKIKDMMLSHFPESAKRPKLVLGHSHEVRYEPVFETQSEIGYEKFPYYFNTGAAGRFENLIWGLEIIEGYPKLVSWNRSGVNKNGELKRSVYFTNSLTQGNKLISMDGTLNNF